MPMDKVLLQRWSLRIFAENAVSISEMSVEDFDDEFLCVNVMKECRLVILREVTLARCQSTNRLQRPLN